MIDKTQLRIGNKVVIAGETNAPVRTITGLTATLAVVDGGNDFGNTHTYDLLLPIPITAELLEKVGFKYIDMMFG